MISKTFNTYFTVVLILTLFISVFFIPTYSSYEDIRFVDFTEDGNLLWPAPRNF